MTQDPEHQKSKCPKCKAGRGEPCVTLDGEEAGKVHYGRPLWSTKVRAAPASVPRPLRIPAGLVESTGSGAEPCDYCTTFRFTCPPPDGRFHTLCKHNPVEQRKGNKAMTEEEAQALADAVRAIAHGGVSGPGGLEALGMSIEGAGRPGHNPLSEAIRDGQHEIAEALREGLEAIATAVASTKGEVT